MFFFLIKFLLTAVLFSLVIGMALVKWNMKNTMEQRLSNLELVAYSLGLGPVVTVLMLYYLLMLLPGMGNLFYFLFIMAVYAGLAVWARESFLIIIDEIKTTLKKGIHFTVIIIAVLIAAFLVMYLSNTLQTPLEGHDILVHGNIGKYYFAEKDLSYRDYIHNEQNGFFYRGSPKPAVSLLLTWELILNHVISEPSQSRQDLYFRSISAYYGLLILLLCYRLLYRQNKYLALVGVVVLLSGLQFFLGLVHYHLDSYRVYFFLLSWVFLVYSLEKPNRFPVILLGLFSGLAAFTHLLGAAAAVLNLSALFIFYKGSFKNRVINALIVAAAIIVSGGIHYILEIFIGASWGIITYV